MECPYGCGDMEQLVSITNVIDTEPERPQDLVEVVYERCHDCGHEENIDVIVTENQTQTNWRESMNKIKIPDTLEPKEFQPEATTFWSFPDRGSWATHEKTCKYRGNWSPYVPRNLILKYSKSGETVLDCFCGSGTTAIEAKLLNRKCIAMDINDNAVKLTRQNLNFKLPKEMSFHEPQVTQGDARDLSKLKDKSIDFICTHPPYANIIQYSKDTKGDLSHLAVDDFLKQMQPVADENFRVLKPNRNCAFLIGDTRENRRIVPLGFMLMRVYLRAGFILKEIIIKEQHNCKMTDKWQDTSQKLNFLLIAHEYLPVFEKPVQTNQAN